MKVFEVMELLKKMDKDADVWISTNGYEYKVVEEVDLDSEGDVVIMGNIYK